MDKKYASNHQMPGGRRLAVAGAYMYAGGDTSDPEGRLKLTYSQHAKMTKSHRLHVASMTPAVVRCISASYRVRMPKFASMRPLRGIALERISQALNQALCGRCILEAMRGVSRNA
jgi:hypothetical protein